MSSLLIADSMSSNATSSKYSSSAQTNSNTWVGGAKTASQSSATQSNVTLKSVKEVTQKEPTKTAGSSAGPDPGKGPKRNQNSEEQKTTATQATKAAKKLDYEKTNSTSHGQPVYYNSKTKTYITPDVDAHNGGVWKMGKSPEALGSKTTRMGTYDASLLRIGD